MWLKKINKSQCFVIYWKWLWIVNKLDWLLKSLFSLQECPFCKRQWTNSNNQISPDIQMVDLQLKHLTVNEKKKENKKKDLPFIVLRGEKLWLMSLHLCLLKTQIQACTASAWFPWCFTCGFNSVCLCSVLSDTFAHNRQALWINTKNKKIRGWNKGLYVDRYFWWRVEFWSNQWCIWIKFEG